jgi:hypothetical protein
MAAALAKEDTETNIQMKLPEEGKNVIEDLLNNMLPSLDEEVQGTRRRNLGSNWAMFNQYFHGDTNRARPVSCLGLFFYYILTSEQDYYPTYYGKNPGPCPIRSEGHTDKCTFLLCTAPESVKQITICASQNWFIQKALGGCHTLRDWINMDDCNNYPTP